MNYKVRVGNNTFDVSMKGWATKLQERHLNDFLAICEFANPQEAEKQDSICANINDFKHEMSFDDVLHNLKFMKYRLSQLFGYLKKNVDAQWKDYEEYKFFLADALKTHVCLSLMDGNLEKNQDVTLLKSDSDFRLLLGNICTSCAKGCIESATIYFDPSNHKIVGLGDICDMLCMYTMNIGVSSADILVALYDDISFEERAALTYLYQSNDLVDSVRYDSNNLKGKLE